MRWCVLWCVAGCAATVPPPRFEAGEVAGGAAARAARRAVVEHADDVAGCFDEMGDRRGVREPMRVELGLQLRGGLVIVTEVAPRDASTVADGEVVRCLADLASRWTVAAADGDVRLPIAVAPRALSDGIAATRRASEPPAFRAEE